MTKVTKKTKPSAAISVVRYLTDLTRPNSDAVLLGFIMEVETPNLKAVGLFAPTSLPASDRAKLDAIARIQLEHPNVYLQRECGKALAEAKGSVIEHLSSQHAWSLQIGRPVVSALPARFSRLKSPDVLIKNVLDQFKALATEAAKREPGRVGLVSDSMPAPAMRRRKASRIKTLRQTKPRKAPFTLSYSLQTQPQPHL